MYAVVYVPLRNGGRALDKAESPGESRANRPEKLKERKEEGKGRDGDKFVDSRCGIR